MNLNQFPLIFKRELEKSTNEQIERINKEHEANVEALRKKKSSSSGVDKSILTGGFVVGLIVGVIVCATMVERDSSLSFGAAVLTCLLFGFAGIAVFLIIHSIIVSAQRSGNDKIDVKISEENHKNEQRIAQVKVREEAEYARYLSEFNAEAQKLSVPFSKSKVAAEVVDWMVNGFCSTIDHADRRKHVEEINVPFVFKTYVNRIECNLGEYNFELNRCDDLRSPLEQAALSRVIASAIQLNITMRYPQDSSGTNIVIDITGEYYEDYVSTTIIYKAPNGNYEATRSWR